MKFDKYQLMAARYDFFQREPEMKASDAGFVEKVLGLTGEAGEVSEKVKKIIRDKGGVVSEEDRKEVAKELGDVLWYVAAIARYLEVPLEEVAQGSIDKLQSRLERGKLGGNGDNR